MMLTMYGLHYRQSNSLVKNNYVMGLTGDTLDIGQFTVVTWRVTHNHPGLGTPRYVKHISRSITFIRYGAIFAIKLLCGKRDSGTREEGWVWMWKYKWIGRLCVCILILFIPTDSLYQILDTFCAVVITSAFVISMLNVYGLRFLWR